jgi:hypothetical protein
MSRQKGRSTSYYGTNVSTNRSINNSENYETPKSLVTNSNNSYFFGESDFLWSDDIGSMAGNDYCLGGESCSIRTKGTNKMSKFLPDAKGPKPHMMFPTFSDDYFEIEETDDSIQNFASDIITQAKNSLFNSKIKIFNELKNTPIRTCVTGRSQEFKTECSERFFILIPEKYFLLSTKSTIKFLF